jgi:hypothetical protein
LFRKVTRDPTETVTARGDTPLAVIVTVTPPGDGVGELGVGLLLPPPHAPAVSASSSAANPAEWLSLRRTSWRY